jgi:membrane-bound lytic murein transglycosylase B
MLFADDLAERRNLDREWVRQAIGQARFITSVQRLMRPLQPSTTGVAWKNWRVYRSRFIDPVRIQAGVKFWRENAAALARAEAQFGVPAEIIVGIIGVETIYGRDMGTFRHAEARSQPLFP